MNCGECGEVLQIPKGGLAIGSTAGAWMQWNLAIPIGERDFDYDKFYNEKAKGLEWLLQGHNHDPNCVRTFMTCKNEHWTTLHLIKKCPVSDCPWKKDSCWCSKGCRYVDSFPFAEQNTSTPVEKIKDWAESIGYKVEGKKIIKIQNKI